MKIRTGFVTNSSSTNFLIITKEELTKEKLLYQLGFKKGSPLEILGKKFVNDLKQSMICYSKHSLDEYQIAKLKDDFGDQSIKMLEKLLKKGYSAYVGYTSTDNGNTSLAVLFTVDSFEICKEDFYLNAKNCVW